MAAAWTCPICLGAIAQVGSYEFSQWVHKRIRHPGMADLIGWVGGLLMTAIVVGAGKGRRPAPRHRKG